MDFIYALFFILPAYFSNAAPVFAKGKTPLDFGNNLKTSRLFGSSKTVRGIAVGIAAGTLVGIILSQTQFYLPELSADKKIFLSLITATGAMAGDLAGSFVKRRLKLKPGTSAMLLDQLPFFLFAFIFARLATPLKLDYLDLTFLTVLTIVVHPAANIIAHKFKLKNVPW